MTYVMNRCGIHKGAIIEKARFTEPIMRHMTTLANTRRPDIYDEQSVE